MGDSNGKIRLDRVLEQLKSSKQKERTQGLTDLKEIFGRQRNESNVDVLSDKSYHTIFEDVFKAAIIEKQALSTTASKVTKASIALRLESCGQIVRLVSKAAGPRLKVKTIEAIVEHVTQTLPESDGGYYKPLTQDYLKALSSLFEHQHIVEFLKPEIWLEVVDFCIQAINQYMDITDGEPSGLSRRFLGLGTNSRSTSILRSTDSVPKNPLSRPNIEDLFQTLLSLVSSTNALLTDRYSSIADSAMRFLQSQGSSVSQVHHLAFSIINAILRFTRIDHYSFSQSIACRSIPVICRIWRGKSLTRDSMLNSVRDEILGLLLTVHLHLERCVRDDKDSDTLSNLEELLDSLRGDYAKRNGEEMLLLDYICMADFSSESCGRGPFRLYPFHLALHNTRGERDWATLQTIGVLERLVNIGYTLRVSVANEVEQIEKHPRKRQRISHNSDRILDPLKNDNEQVRTSGLQLIPFVLEDCQLPINELRVLLDQLIKCTTDKRSNIASWALLALASCTNQNAIADIAPAEWIQTWHIGARALTFSATSRAAALHLHALVAKGLVHYHDIGADIDAIISTSDTNGPMIVCDSSTFLMSHLLHVRVTEVPGASLAASQQVIRWLFARWNPVDRDFAAHHAAHVRPHHLANLLRTCMGLPQVTPAIRKFMPCETAGQAWQYHLDTQDIIRYILLLPKQTNKSTSPCPSCPPRSNSGGAILLNNSSFHAARKLVLELAHPKWSEILTTWKSFVMERSSAVSTDIFRSGIYSCIAMSLLMPHFADANPTQVRTIQEALPDMIKQFLQFLDDADLRDSNEARKLNETLLQSLEPYLPACRSEEFHQLLTTGHDLLSMLVSIADNLSKRQVLPARISTQVDIDDMDIDFDSPRKDDTFRPDRQKILMPRRDLALDTWSGTFYRVTMDRLVLIRTASADAGLLGYVPPKFVDYLLDLSMQDILASRRLLQEIVDSDLILDDTNACRVLVHVGEILSSNEFGRCEVALQTCLDVMVGLWRLWSGENGSDIAEAASQIYGWVIETALEKNLASPDVQKSIARLLFLLIRQNQEYGAILDLPSPRSSLLNLLRKSNVFVKFYIGSQLSQIFALFLLKDHDTMFVDIQDVLPCESDWMEGIFLRLFVFARLASNWPNLLRRCIYHIFETAGMIPASIEHASRCLEDISADLKVEGPRKLFELFAPQILYTWLEKEKIDSIPFQIFGFSALRDLVQDAQEETTALMIMRSQDEAVDKLAYILDISATELIQRSFTKVIAYSIAHDISTPPRSSEEKYQTGEARVRKRVGPDAFYESINLHFADIIAVLFNVVERESDIERYFSKNPELAYAADTMSKIKSMGSSDTKLPLNQQPNFRAKFLALEIQHLCRRTQYDISTLYTPTMVTFIARKLLSTIHPALGSLHACSVLRKVRIMISLAGKSAIDGYPLEMLLQSIRPYITDGECADDAIGILQYLMSHGLEYLQQTPTFVAGLALTTLGSLRVFLESQRASTTQESQHKSTMNKAQKLHSWTGQYMSTYDSPLFSVESKASFKAMIQSAFLVHSVGNAERMTPESQLLVQLLEDEKCRDSLLSRPSRELVLQMLSTGFRSPASFRLDALGTDDMSAVYAGVILRSCKGSNNKQYVTWAARVLGRAFAASGHIHEELLRESTFFRERELSASSDSTDDPRTCILRLLRDLTLGYDSHTTGLAETALRDIMTTSEEAQSIASQNCIADALRVASTWYPYQIPPSETAERTKSTASSKDILDVDAISKEHWLRDLSIAVAQSVPKDVLLGSLVPVLRGTEGFANHAFPFILHLVLSAPAQDQLISRKQLSKAFMDWFTRSEIVEKDNSKTLLNAILYLRTQPLPGERSTADRSQWLEIDYLKAATAATHCGMFKTSLLFVEEFCFQPVKSSRRSSAIKDPVDQVEVSTEILLAIFENVDDPDMYYGVQQKSNLNSILARFEYEKDGPKSLAFRGARYDSHIRRHDPESGQDVQSLVKALDVLNLSGLSHSLLQAQQTVGMTPESLESMFHTARKLEQWDIPVPGISTSNSVAIYKTYQAIDTASDRQSILQAINEGFEYTMKYLSCDDLSSSALHGSLQTLAALLEIDEVFSSNGSEQFEEIQERFKSRSNWMKIGRFEDVTQILSCRATTLSTLSHRPRLQELLQVKPIDTRLVEVYTALLASKINRAHSALQESLSLATSMIDLITPCNEVGISPEVAIHLEAANSLWDQGEMISSIGMLQALDSNTLLKKQTIQVGRSDLLSRIGYQVSVARLEKADRIIEKFLKPALKELKGKTKGAEAGQVFHQFAVFCDQQLQDPDSVEDLERLKRLRKNKANEVKEYDSLIQKAQTTHDKNRYKGLQAKARIWLKLDDDELQRHNNSRDEFLRQCLENYLLALSASDDHDSNALRFSALWLGHSEEKLANEAVSKQLSHVPSRKFASLMNQLSSRLQDTEVEFQQLLFALVLRICTEHPLHGMYQMYAGIKSRINEKDESAVSRRSATNKVVLGLDIEPRVRDTWVAVERTNRYYCGLAQEKDEQKYKAGRKISMKDSRAASTLNKALSTYRLPPPTMPLTLRADMDYSKLPVMTRLESQFSIASGVSAPKIITVVGNNGVRYKQLVKGGNDDLRQDAIMEQVFEQVSELLKTNRSTRQRNLSIRTYKVLPLTNAAGVIEFVADTIPLHEYLMPAHERYYPKDLKGNQCRNEIGNVSTKPVEARIQKYRQVTERFHPVMRYFFTEKFSDPDEWFVKRLAYSRSTAAISILGHVLGLGDRHGHNILLDSKSGEVVHIDLGVAFEMGRVLPVPELVPFRLTRDIVDGMGITKTEGVFRRCCEFTLEALRKEVYSIMTILDVLRYDPLYSWSISPIRLARLQEGQSAAAALDTENGHVHEKTKESVNEPGEADRALTVVNKKLSKTLSVTATVNDLINQASDERNLAVLYSGWAAYA